MKDWFKQFILYHQLQHSEIKPRLDNAGIKEESWATDKWSYLYAMDALKCVIARKEQELLDLSEFKGVVSPASKYYGIWSINGYNGVQKFRTYANL